MELTLDMHKKIMSKMYGLIIVDADCRLVFIEKTYAKLLRVDAEEVVGEPFVNIFPETRLREVILSGKPILGEIFSCSGLTFTCHRYPIYNNDKVVGAFAHWANISDQLVDLIEKLKRRIKLYSAQIQKTPTSRYSLEDIIGGSRKMEALRSTIIAAALSKSTILIQGETGTGKELVAHSLHHESARAGNPFVKVNCAAIPDNLIESELFGYEEGAFTGAKRGGHKGKFEQADGGTIFLDEISQLSLSAQAKLLRVLQDKEVGPLGGSAVKTVDVRVIACTNDDLKVKVAERAFRDDLFYRLNVIPVKVPPLRERLEDIPALFEFFLDKYVRLSGRLKLDFDAEVCRFLMKYQWPGNIRELEHAIERVVNLCSAAEITASDFSWLIDPYHNVRSSSLPKLIEQIEYSNIVDALARANGNKKKAADMLGISRPLLYQKMKRLDVATSAP